MFKEINLVVLSLALLTIYHTDGCFIRSMTSMLSSQDDSSSSDSDEDYLDAFFDIIGLSDKKERNPTTTVASTTTSSTTEATTTASTTTQATTTTGASTTSDSTTAASTTEKPK